jgi:hypothetical protein
MSVRPPTGETDPGKTEFRRVTGSRFGAVVTAAIVASAVALPTSAAQARLNRQADPHGRIVDVTFETPVALIAPWDRFRFSIDIVQPLTRESGAFLGDLDGDGVRDLFLASWDGSLVFVPGIAGQTRLFGMGTLLRHTVASPGEDPYEFPTTGDYVSGDVGDLDGDGRKEVVIGRHIYRNLGTAPQVLLDPAYLLPRCAGPFDPSVSLGDLDGDGDLDAVVTHNYASGDAHVYWNSSSPGSFAFTCELLADTQPGWQPDNRLGLGDLDGDGLVDLAGAAGIYFNTGTKNAPVWNVFSPAPWNLTGGPPWEARDDFGTNLFLVDADGDGDLDVYASGTEDTVWQALYYRNEGTATAHLLVYDGPVAARQMPLSITHRGSDFPNLSSSRANPSAADLDGDGRVDITVGGAIFYAGAAILWNRTLSPPFLTYPDLHTWPALPLVNDYCGGGSWGMPEALCRPPTNILAWRDVNGDGAVDALLKPDNGIGNNLSFYAGTGGWPFNLNNRPYPYSTPLPLVTSGTGEPISARGAAWLDVDLDGKTDLVAGWDDGTLRWYRNTADAGLVLADPVPLADGAGVPIKVGDEAWPAAIDLDGDGDLDLLVATDAGPVREVLCVTPGQANGFALGGWLAAGGQAPFDVTGVVGGGYNGLSLLATDHDGDGLVDVLAGDDAGRVWLLRNAGKAQAPNFAVEPLQASQTTAAYLEIIDSTTIRLYFALPLVAGETNLTFYQVSTGAGAISGTAPVRATTPRRTLRGQAPQ